jgi:hypothetical protein
VGFSNVTWTNAAVRLVNDGNLFDFTVNTSDLDAQAGDDGTNPANKLTGSITVDGTAINGIDAALDPAFEQAAFDATYQCEANGSPQLVDDATCSFRQVLGDAAAKLLVKAVGTAASVHDKNTSCGFAADASPTPAPSGTPPAPGTLTFDSAASCQSGFASDTVLSSDCVPNATHAAGAFVTTSGTKLVNGFFTGLANPSFVPNVRDAATLTLTGIGFSGWTVFDTDVNGVTETKITVVDGSADVVVSPIDGWNANASGALGIDVFDQSTGTAGIGGLTMASGNLVLELFGKTFKVQVSDVDIDAFAGFYADNGTEIGSNDITGSITVDGEPVTITPRELNDGLTPLDFTATYSCSPALGGDTIPFP